MTIIGQPRRDAVTAAASPITINRGTPIAPTVKDAGELWNLYRSCGPVAYGVDFKASAASKIRYYVARLDPEGGEPDSEVPEQVAEVWDEFDDGFDGGYSTAMDTMVTQWEVVGEMAVVNQDTETGDSSWSIYSTTEWKESNRYYSTSKHRDAAKDLKESNFAFKVWQPDPEHRENAISSVRIAAPDISQYLSARDMVDSLIWSASSAGILPIPNEMLAGIADQEFPQLDVVVANIIRAISAVAEDRNAGNRIAPTTVTGPAAALSAMDGTIDLIRDIPERTLELLDSALRRIATSMDLPAELLLGMGDINHWGQWFVDESARVNHVDPTVLAICRSVTTGYLRPMLRNMGVTDASEYVVWRDFSDLTARQLTVEQAIAMYTERAISASALRRIADLSEEDSVEAETPEGEEATNEVNSDELAKRATAAGIFIRSGFEPEAALQAVGLPPIAHTGLLPVTVKDTQQVPETTETEALEIEDDQPEGEVEVGLSERRDPPVTAAATQTDVGRRLAEIDRSTFAALDQLAESEIARAVEKAASRLRSAMQGVPDAKQRLADLEGAALVAALADDMVEAGLDVDTLIPASTWDRLRSRARDILASAVTQARSLFGLSADVESVDGAVENLTVSAQNRTLRLLDGETADLVTVDASDVWQTMGIAAGAGVADGASWRGVTAAAVEWAQEAGYVVEARRWVTGAPADPFEPHHHLAGRVFEDWDDPVLANGAAFPSTSFFYPGDHSGCVCSVEPVLVLFDEVVL